MTQKLLFKTLIGAGLLGAISLLPACAQNASQPTDPISNEQIEPKPEDTEDWSIKPPLLTFDENGIPSDAIILFNGGDLSEWVSEKTETIEWTIEDGILTVTPDSGNIKTVRDFCDVQLHLEWRSPLTELVVDGVDGKGQLWGNSGVFLQSRYEVQILNSHNNETYSNGQAGSIYKQYAPAVNASLPVGEWQSYNITFTAPRFGDDDELTSPARLTVLHNGVVIQNNVEVLGETVFIGKPSYRAHSCAPIKLQDHWEAVEFRNIWVRELN